MRIKMHTLHASKMACLIYIVIFMSFCSFVSGGSDANEVLQKDQSNRKTCEGAKSENPGMHCCAGKPYNPETDTCCRDKGGEKKTDKMNEKVSKCCGLQAYNPLNEMCCDFTVQTKPFPMAECCGKAAFSSKTQLCCGENRKILGRISPDHRCCYENQYNIKTECCCSGQIQPKVSGCCGNNSTTRTGLNSPARLVHEHQRPHFCGSESYDPKTESCCQRKHGDINAQCPLGAKPPTTVYDPKTHICCDGCLTKLQPWMDKCCGDSPHGLAQRGVLCCGNRLYHNREDGEECSESGVPYKPFAETVCAHKRHNSPGGHCCGEELYQPNKTVCCKGQRYDRGKYIRCCGIHAYNISDPLKKCCKGTLHNLTTGEENDLECCGSELLNATNQEVCCTSEEQSLFYPAKDGFRCCGHHYYDSALWSCCAGKLSPVHHQTTHTRPNPKESKLQLVNNLNKTQLCNEVFIGVVESVSRSSTVFSNVLKITGKEATVESDVFVLETPDQCKFFKLTAGKTYFFNRADVFADFNHESVLQLLHFILSKCSQ
ncbi:uncharacterized protein LOC106963246 [Poecilia latipinna]|uniref:uncharacterized protein LOC106963246 n=1 Tax=Poecilia latipinna TaxID=48699 RepID=UPI00072D9E4B|nr:PREDICTED: uncharacterized protein LOC106963246 [Poecilia latipinna]